MPIAAEAQPAGFNYDEAKVPAYTLPDPLALLDGGKITDPKAWPARRAEILGLFQSEVYGKIPHAAQVVAFKVTRVVPHALGGLATRKHISILFDGTEAGPKAEMLLYVPNRGAKPFPAFVGLNFEGNQAVDPDPSIPLPTCWFPDRPAEGFVDHKATEKTRGAESSRWPLKTILGRGYAVATACYNEIDPDFDDSFKNGVHPLLDPREVGDRPDDAWGSIAAWAWGLSLMLDHLKSDPDIDGDRVAVWGHSRLGKAALWAGAWDQRFALVISNESGCGGAALSRRAFGETVARINTSFPHWFCGNHKKYNDKEANLPVDQHELIALMAPRPVLVCSAEGDRWADPRGEFLAAREAGPVYELLGQTGLGVVDMPPPGTLVGGTVGYFIRPGEHDVKDEDWQAFLDFADRHLRGR
jgi:hypothetical protein